MLNRRLIRIKVFQSIFGSFKDDTVSTNEINKAAEKSILGIEQNSYAVLAFLVEFRHLIRSEHNPGDLKYKATPEDIRLFDAIVNNEFIDALEVVPHFKKYLSKPTLEWQQEKEVMFIIYKQIKVHEQFVELLNAEPDTKNQFDIAKFIYKFLIKESVEFEMLMEERIIVWYDEKIPILKNIETLFSTYEETSKIIIPELSKNIKDDLSFAKELVVEYYKNKAEIQEVIDTYTPGWDSERITKIDYVLMCMALCEFRYLSFVPVKVTINEYIEIAKMYSTPQSSKFVNGTLDKILKDWQAEGIINKTGRGLIG